MSKKYTFPVPGCGECPHHQRVGGALCGTRYCAGFKRRKPKRFRKSDPTSKAPKWCPRRIAPPACRVHGFKDERSAYMDLLWRAEYGSGRMEPIAPSPHRYAPRTEIPLGMTARQFFDATQERPLRDILPKDVADGEIIEIDDGLKPYCFYKLDYATVVPLPYFRFPPTTKEDLHAQADETGH